jgi:hypothetical protein
VFTFYYFSEAFPTPTSSVLSISWNPTRVIAELNGVIFHNASAPQNIPVSLEITAAIPNSCPVTSVTLPGEYLISEIVWACPNATAPPISTTPSSTSVSTPSASTTAAPVCPKLEVPVECSPTLVNITGSIIVNNTEELPLTTQTVITGNLTVEKGGVLTINSLNTTAIEILSGCARLEKGSILKLNLTLGARTNIGVLQQSSNCAPVNFTTVELVQNYGGDGCAQGEQSYQDGKLSVLLQNTHSCKKDRFRWWIALVIVGVILLIALVIFIFYLLAIRLRKITCCDVLWRSTETDD